jgi:hypothetical protein
MKTLFFVGITAAVLLASLTANAVDVSVCSILANRTSYDHQNIAMQGTATASHAGNDYTTFNLLDGGCEVKIFSWGHPSLTNGSHVRVEGVYEVEHHQGRYTFYNEVQATKVIPGSR